MLRPGIASLVGALLILGLASCAGPVASGQSSNQHSWRLLLTVKTAGVSFGIPGIALDGHGNLYAAEFDDDLIYKFTVGGKLEARWGGRGTDPGQLEGPDKLAFDEQGNLYVTEVGAPFAGPSRIQKFSATGQPLAQWGAYGSAPGQFDNPIGIAVDHQGDVYVAEEANVRVQKLSSTGLPVMRWGSRGSGPGQFNVPYDLALDTSGNVYVSEPGVSAPGNDRIQKFSPAGVPLAQWGGPGAGPGQFNNPTGLAVDARGDVFVVDSGNHRIQELSATGQYLAQWNEPAPLLFTSKVALDNQGNMYGSVGSSVFKLTMS